MNSVPRPAPTEYAPYAEAYLQQIPPGYDVLGQLAPNAEMLRDVVLSIPAQWHAQPFAAGEWTVKEIVQHVMDSERVFAYRALRIARGDQTPLPGFDQDPYVPASGANARSINDLLEEYASVRAATLTLFRSFSPAVYSNIGTASGAPLSVRAAMHIVAGHELHHIVSLRQNYVGRV